MGFSEAKKVREFAPDTPGAMQVFDGTEIGYCDGRPEPITPPFQPAGAQIETTGESTDWQTESLASLITYIYDKHHIFTREELGRIEPILARACSVQGEKRPKLLEIQSLFADLKDELLFHMAREENILFPYIRQLEAAANAGLSAPQPPFGTVRNPVRMMMLEHDQALDVLRRIRELSDDFHLPADACVDYRSLYLELDRLEQDLRRHINLENDILFPRAIDLEASLPV
jgi:regulator of cell morphogenesis and NO signaling